MLNEHDVICLYEKYKNKEKVAKLLIKYDNILYQKNIN